MTFVSARGGPVPGHDHGKRVAILLEHRQGRTRLHTFMHMYLSKYIVKIVRGFARTLLVQLQTRKVQLVKSKLDYIHCNRLRK